MQVIHQSPAEVMLTQEEQTIPLYCIASGHCLEYTYRWNLSGRHTGVNSPVCWVNQPGLYQCRVEHHIMQDECSSHLIVVNQQSG